MIHLFQTESVANHPVRLLNEDGEINRDYGRVEVYHDGEWRSVCLKDDGRIYMVSFLYGNWILLLNLIHIYFIFINAMSNVFDNNKWFSKYSKVEEGEYPKAKRLGTPGKINISFFKNNLCKHLFAYIK